MDKLTENKFYKETAEPELTTPNYSEAENELRKTIQRQKKTMFRLVERVNKLRITCVVLVILLVIETILLWVNSGSDDAPEVPVNPEQMNTEVIDVPEPPVEDTVILDDVDENQVNSIITEMSIEEKICQMIFAVPEILTDVPAVTMAGESTKNSLEKLPVGGVIYSQINLEDRQQVKTMLENIKGYSKIGLFLGINEEGGSNSILTKNENVSTMAVASADELGSSGDRVKVSQTYLEIGKELKSLGFNVNLAPVAEIATSGNTKFLSRSFGSTSTSVADMVAAAVEGGLSINLSSALKYFPGESCANESGVSERTLEQLRASEFAPFKSGIDKGADFVILSNTTNKYIAPGGEPCSMSADVVNILRNELGFKGIVMTDVLSDSKIADVYSIEDTAVNCVKAGVDMLLAPKGITKSVTAVKEAVESGEISESTIDESVKRILRIKLKRGIQ